MLDHHPPIAECNAEFLEGALPCMLQTAGATICLAVGHRPILKRIGSLQNIDKKYFEKLPLSESWNNEKGRLNIDYLTYASFKNRPELIDVPHEAFV